MARRFTEQFKKDALSYVHDHSDQSINACARNLGISTCICQSKIPPYFNRKLPH